jgi:hypothetical protein
MRMAMAERVLDSGGDPAETGPLPPIVLDLSLVLSPFGPWLAQRLSLLTSVWLPTRHALLQVGEGKPLSAEAKAEFKPMIELWARCWPETVQHPGVYWLSDDIDRSHAPKGEPPALLDRFDALVALLDGKANLHTDKQLTEAERLRLEGLRDALALVAALGAARRQVPPIVLAALHDDDDRWIRRALARFGIAGRRLSEEPLRELLASGLLKGLARAGLAPLLGGGAPQLAALHLAAPGCAVPLPRARYARRHEDDPDCEPDDDALASPFEEEADPGLWANAAAVWHEVP